MDKHAKQPIGRLAMREEGKLWCAYYAQPQTMHEAVLLGAIHLGIIKRSADTKAAFVAMMRDALTALLEDGGYCPNFGDARLAPEHERGGNA